MMETITITLPKKMPIARRITETGNRLRDWIRGPDVLFNDERDKLQFAKWELKNAQYHYQYSVVRAKTLSAGKMNTKHAEQHAEFAGPLETALQTEEPSTDISPDPGTMLTKQA